MNTEAGECEGIQYIITENEKPTKLSANIPSMNLEIIYNNVQWSESSLKTLKKHVEVVIKNK